MTVSYSDMVDLTLDYLGASADEQAVRDAKKAVQATHRELPTLGEWSFYLKHGRLNTVATYGTGTVAYTSSSRALTLTGGTWPTWAAAGEVRIGVVSALVESRDSNSQLTLRSSLTFPDDIASGTAYTIYQDTYQLPDDFVTLDRPFAQEATCLEQTSYQDWLYSNRYRSSSGTPYTYTVSLDPERPGRFVVRFYPWPSSAQTIDYLYRGRPRELFFERVTAGTATLTGSSTTVTGSGTAWDSRMIGSLFRASATATDDVTGNYGLNPARFEAKITAVASTTSLTVDTAPTSSLSAVKYQITDPVEMDEGCLRTAYEKGCIAQVAVFRNKKEMASAKQEYVQAVLFARDADSRYLQQRRAGWSELYPRRLKDMPITYAGES